MATMTSSVEKSEPQVSVRSPSAASSTSTKPTTSSGKRSKKSKLDKAKSPSPATPQSSQEEDINANDADTVDHPYLSFLHKRIRSYKKKLEKIKGLESARASKGKKLNAQQLELVGNKAVMEKLIAEFETLREQFLEVFLLEEAAKKPEEKAAAAIAAVDEEVEVEQEVEVVIKEVEKDAKHEQKPEDAFANVYELLKTLHVVNLHQALGKEVPMVLDFFSKVLLGNTRPPAELSYEENLDESLEEAKKYLTGSDKVFACETTYSELRAFVDQLASGKTNAEQEEVADEEHVAIVEEVVVVETPVVPTEINTLPQINFFTESQLETEGDSDVTPEVVEQVVVRYVNYHFVHYPLCNKHLIMRGGFALVALTLMLLEVWTWFVVVRPHSSFGVNLLYFVTMVLMFWSYAGAVLTNPVGKCPTESLPDNNGPPLPLDQ
ncbi:hypothetical protein BBO99_00009064 [Phytophthora kernoviae]|uniref:Uncharacterized protein n=2 Tax=Phytophthora kernoviae TaxID=325452 RepID=A0A421EUF8_9STRA|nr:hypothetical protein G195_010076 [Phytophthora kernoviae 00238/432]KAG2507470.1 hypothetical protein JM16_008927 [Phytophthora kernoviae]KAG2510579.1 hypothetical protein JM18_008878 [Phytophthora kernoviae]RLN02381.1 hypothetical protein BBI17_009072 [Phytophthora kernoviae]RLN74164.1 hypothetical protein BBO99_00009064 [Phytophthora kernoviae]